MIYIISFTTTFLICLLLIRKPICKSIPSNRGLHQYNVPSSGGLAILIGFSLAMIFDSERIPLLLIILTSITLIGLIDDIYHISKIFRFGSQIILSGLTIYMMNGINLEYISILIIIFLITYFINAYNFMDGIDSIIIFQTLYILFSFILLLEITPIWNSTIMIMISSALAFLMFNISPAKLFLGNSGSYLLGMYVSIVIIGLLYMSNLSIITALIICTIIITDTTYVILKRFFDKFITYYKNSSTLDLCIINSIKHVTEAHCSHNYQKLTKMYESHNKVVLLLMIYNIIWCFPLSKLSIVYQDMGALWLLLSYTPYIAWCVFNQAGVDKK